VATDRYWIAVVLAALNLFTLRVLLPIKQKLDRDREANSTSASGPSPSQ
jgi:hypothetical protein